MKTGFLYTVLYLCLLFASRCGHASDVVFNTSFPNPSPIVIPLGYPCSFYLPDGCIFVKNGLPDNEYFGAVEYEYRWEVTKESKVVASGIGNYAYIACAAPNTRGGMIEEPGEYIINFSGTAHYYYEWNDGRHFFLVTVHFQLN